MKEYINKFMKIGKVILYALLTVQYVYAVWWVIGNIGVLADFSIASEAFIYAWLVDLMGKGFFVLYLGQAITLYFGIMALFPKNHWVARFTITNPLIIQFVFSATPDIFAVAVVLLFLASFVNREELRSKHAMYLVLLGVLSSRYFLIGILILAAMVIREQIDKRRGLEKTYSNRENLARGMARLYILFVIVLVFITYQTRGNTENKTSVEDGFQTRFTVDESMPSNHSRFSVLKGFAVDSLSYALTPFDTLYVIDEFKLTQNSWNYINFTREKPEWSRHYVELTTRNMVLVAALFLVTGLTRLTIFPEKKKELYRRMPYYVLLVAICIVIAATSKRGMDYRNGLLLIPVWYGMILTPFSDVKIFEKKEEGTCL